MSETARCWTHPTVSSHNSVLARGVAVQPTDEEWRAVRGYEGFYEVSSLGKVRSVDREFIRADGRFQRRRGRLLRPSMAGPARNYLSVGLRFGHRRTIHVLVCEAFHGPRPDGDFEAAHNNGVSTDNRKENLRWTTHADNVADSRQHGTYALIPAGPGEKAPNAHLTWIQVDEIRARWANGETQASLGIAYRIGKTQVHNIVRGKSWVDESWRVE